MFGVGALGFLILASKKRAPASPGSSPPVPGASTEEPPSEPLGLPIDLDEVPAPEPSNKTRRAEMKRTWESILRDMLSLERYYQKKGQDKDANVMSAIYVKIDEALPKEMKLDVEPYDIADKKTANQVFDRVRDQLLVLSREAAILGLDAVEKAAKRGHDIFSGAPAAGSG